MITVAGIFTNRAAAEQAIEDLRTLGIDDHHAGLLVPEDQAAELAAVPTAESEAPGMGRAVGSVVGGAVGVAGGLSLGTAAAVALLVPGIGPVLALGTLGAAVLGLAGAMGGGAVGKSIDRAMLDGVPKDEIFVYEDALRQGRSVVICLARDETERDEARRILEGHGAESIDAAHRDWWTGVRDAEREHYAADGLDFETDEEIFRRGFTAALNPEFRGRTWEQAVYILAERDADWSTPCFRKGFERGRRYYFALQG
jgi:hypothetical protein